MLPRAARLRTAEEFRTTMRRGVRCGRPSLVLHMLRTDNPPSRAGFVVSKAIGNAVTRNRVKRQLRHLVVDRLAATPFQLDVVVRALPHDGVLADDLNSAWTAAAERLAAS
ncbi:MAG: ribonuclease P protein component [Propionibacterium sp.]|nr:ribonuclease P protein component [Propionibacterium sp.]